LPGCWSTSSTCSQTQKETEMNTNEILAGTWLAKDDVDRRGVLVHVARVSVEEVGQDKQVKWALHFDESLKPMLLNKSNIRVLAALYGPETKEWTGKEIIVYNDPTISYAGQITGGLRLRMPEQAPARAIPARPAPSDAVDSDSPF
jgi:hypothetical protein